jgi:hypothetical protein
MLRADSALAQEAPTTVSRPVEATEPYNQGVQLISEEKYKGFAALNQAIAADGTFAEAYISKGDAAEGDAVLQEAAEAYSRALEMSRRLTPRARRLTTARRVFHRRRRRTTTWR